MHREREAQGRGRRGESAVGMLEHGSHRIFGALISDGHCLLWDGAPSERPLQGRLRKGVESLAGVRGSSRVRVEGAGEGRRRCGEDEASSDRSVRCGEPQSGRASQSQGGTSWSRTALFSTAVPAPTAVKS